MQRYDILSTVMNSIVSFNTGAMQGIGNRMRKGRKRNSNSQYRFNARRTFSYVSKHNFLAIIMNREIGLKTFDSITRKNFDA